MMMHFTVILSKPPFYYPHIYLNFIVESGEIVLLPTSSCHISLHVSNPYIYLTQGSQPSLILYTTYMTHSIFIDVLTVKGSFR